MANSKLRVNELDSNSTADSLNLSTTYEKSLNASQYTEHSIASSSSSIQISLQRSLGSCKSHNPRNITLREAIYEIEVHAKKNLPPPSFVPPLESIPLEAFQWNKKKKKIRPRNNKNNKHKNYHANDNDSINSNDTQNQSRKNQLNNTGSNNIMHRIPSSISFDPNLRTMNIIGCHHPIELILSRADERSRKAKIKQDYALQLCESKRQELLAVIDYRNNIQERIVQKLQLEKNRMFWLKAMHLMNFSSQLHTIYVANRAERAKRREALRAATKICVSSIIWYKSHIARKYYKIRELLLKNFLSFRLNLGIHMKRNACAKIITFLEESKKSVKMSLIVKHYLQSVRKVQHHIRTFLVCRRERVSMLLSLFNKYEAVYIKKRLDDDNFYNKHPHLLQATKKIGIESFQFKKQEKKFSQLDTKIEKNLNKHRILGNMKKNVSPDCISKLMLPMSVKRRCVVEYIRSKRKEHILSQTAEMAKLMARRAKFSPTDAMEMLKARDTKEYCLHWQDDVGNLGNLAKAKLHTPFLLYSNNITWQMQQEIIRLHEMYDTFNNKSLN